MKKEDLHSTGLSILRPLLLLLLLQILVRCSEPHGEGIDENGVPFYVYHNMGKQRNPLFIASQANKYGTAVQRGNDSLTPAFFNCVDWLVQRLEIKDSLATLPYTFPLPDVGVDPPWYSALANSRCLETFMIAFEISGDSSYLAHCEKLLTSFHTPVDNGGCLTYLHGDWWFAEYAAPGTQSPYVLNGMISSVQWIRKYNQHFPSRLGNKLTEKGLETIRKHLYRFHDDGISFYSLDSTEAAPNYYRLHLKQMKQLHVLTNDEIYREMELQWQPRYQELMLTD